MGPPCPWGPRAAAHRAQWKRWPCPSSMVYMSASEESLEAYARRYRSCLTRQTSSSQVTIPDRPTYCNRDNMVCSSKQVYMSESKESLVAYARRYRSCLMRETSSSQVTIPDRPTYCYRDNTVCSSKQVYMSESKESLVAYARRYRSCLMRETSSSQVTIPDRPTYCNRDNMVCSSKQVYMSESKESLVAYARRYRSCLMREGYTEEKTVIANGKARKKNKDTSSIDIKRCPKQQEKHVPMKTEKMFPPITHDDAVKHQSKDSLITSCIRIMEHKKRLEDKLKSSLGFACCKQTANKQLKQNIHELRAANLKSPWPITLPPINNSSNAKG
ncbi:uncharacterized protein LOC142158068 isoform X2 [Mixophyes fleayi]|uniref:uncharacterized protein LOC142158068 isoform X2 n=1 Tax=Mixophyes fleayi TaxID=3061075 RepID=UPI003F4DFE2A